MNEMVVILTILFLIYTGFLIIKFFKLLPKTSNLEITPFAYGLGIGSIAFQLFIYSIVGISWNPVTILIPWIILSVFAFWKNPNLFKSKVEFNFNLKKIDKVILISIILLILFVFYEAQLRPLSAWDGWASWLLKAKIFFIDGYVKPNIFNYLNSEYPLVVSLFSSFVYTVLGQVDDKAILLFFFSFYFMLFFIFVLSLKKYINTTFAILTTFLLISLQNLIRHGGRYEGGQADLALGFYIFTSVILFITYLKDRAYKTLILLNIFLGITANIKNEGIPFSIFLQGLTLYTLIKSRLYRYTSALALGIIPILGWQLYKYTNNLPKLPAFILFDFHFERIPIVVLEISKEFINIKNWNMLWIVFFVTLLFYLLKKNKEKIGLLYFIIFFQLFVYLGVFLATPVNPAEHIRNVVDRLLIHLAPISVFVTSVIVFNKNK